MVGVLARLVSITFWVLGEDRKIARLQPVEEVVAKEDLEGAVVVVAWNTSCLLPNWVRAIATGLRHVWVVAECKSVDWWIADVSKNCLRDARWDSELLHDLD